MRNLFAGLGAFQLLLGCHAVTHTFDWNVTWVTANPDGLADRKVIGINDQWPLPVLEVNKGDRVVVNMFNGLGDKKTSIHWHGMYQEGTNDMDGPSMVTQCPVAPGSSYTYNFTVNQNGTYWYHCHTDYCYPDGYRAPFIVHDNSSYFYDDYDEEMTLTMSDWYHTLAEDIKPEFMSLYNPTGAEPIPDSFLFNNSISQSYPVQAGKTYLIRLINISAFVGQYFWIEDHTMRIVEIDGVYVDEAEADRLYLSVAQRYAVLVTMKNSTEKNYGMVMVADSSLLDTIPSDLLLNQTNWLEYNSGAAHNNVTLEVSDSSEIYPFDDINLVPHDRVELYKNPTKTVEVTVIMENLDNGDGYALLNNITYTAPKVPTLYTVKYAGDLATDSTVYGEYTHSIVLEQDEVVEVILSNQDTGTHPFHLHGHNFQLLDRYPPYGANFYDYDAGTEFATFDSSNHTAFPTYPARRDTFVLPPGGYYVIRFVASNPGVWLFHCHIDWHMMQGLAMTFVEDPLAIQDQFSISQNQIDVCEAASMSWKGNAAGNTEDYLDLKGQNKPPGFIPAGFTTRGIVALVFSCICAVVGMISISIYGISDLKFTMHESGLGDESATAQEREEYRD
ncbi:Multicopper oxidase type 2 [Penicillium cataractarum]|uniref:Multicopper oxidase type 2 n=1 Tax=Penicillium cataractarum TaxID=2100454 RepID=A0A9W9RNN8_9EURO|nr:Multicopper oxidase type 2 [Penicillium cataractarum]KAJ5363571.1 Multicopper oxidase type 2 [Penicillium cataractarum]